MGKVLKTLYYMDKDDICTEIYLNEDNTIDFKNHTSNILNTAFGVKTKVTRQDLNTFLESRCFPKSRVNCKELLRLLGVDFYEPMLIVRKTHGIMGSDTNWVKFEGENISYEEAKSRVGL